ncbi:hypothetical protein BH11BAC7_BH11BAC7_10650 [soil metagenome]
MFMKHNFHILAGVISLVVLSSANLAAQNVAINATGAAPNGSAMLDITSTTSGFLMPRMTTVQRSAIPAPATGLRVYDTTTGGFWFYNGAIWVQDVNSGTGWLLAGNTLAGTEKLGSINSQPVKLFSANTERMRITNGANGEIVLNQPGASAYFAGDIFSVYSAAGNYAVNGYASGTGAAGYFQNTSANGFAVYGVVSGAANTRPGVIGTSSNTSGTGVVGLGNNLASYNTLVAGSGGAFTGSGVALYAKANTAVAGTGVLGVGNNSVGNTLAAGSGGAFTGVTTGVYSVSSTAGVGEAVYTSQFGNIVRVNYWNGGTQFKIAGTGTMPVSCAVKDAQGVDRTLYCSESPEFYFEDYGQGQLVNGQAHINIDSLLAKYVIIDETHPLRVYIQIEGDENCKGVVVKNKSGNGFDVVEMMGGTSTTTFQWHIICNVANQDMGGGRINHLADVRFQPMGEKHVIIEQANNDATALPKKPEPVQQR